MEAKNLITRMLDANPNERITMSEIKAHYWFSSSVEYEYGYLLARAICDLEEQAQHLRNEFKHFEELLAESVASGSLPNFWITVRGKNTYCDINLSMLFDNPNSKCVLKVEFLMTFKL